MFGSHDSQDARGLAEIKLYETYNGTQNLYFLLELALGGELYATYNKKGLFGKEPHAKFYTAGVVLAFEHMHSKKIIFRALVEP